MARHPEAEIEAAIEPNLAACLWQAIKGRRIPMHLSTLRRTIERQRVPLILSLMAFRVQVDCRRLDNAETSALLKLARGELMVMGAQEEV